MIPIKLTLQGIYSYQTQQTIDFTKLTAAKLFGIFGSVGSGKSTILEAISFALYGQTERLNKNDSPNYNMMNLKSNEFFLEFDFLAGSKYEEEYRFTVKTKRNRKNYEDVGSFDRKCYKKINEDWIPLENKTGEEIIGLSYENFRRTVIIPQGQFQEFISLGEKDRTNMLKELFNLNRFDLFFKTTNLDTKNKAEIENTLGQLEQISIEADPEIILAKEAEIEELAAHLKQLNSEHNESIKKEKTLSELKILFENIAKIKKTLSSLLEKQDEFKQKENQLKIYEACQKNFKDILSQKKKLDLDLTKGDTSLKEKKAVLSKSFDLQEKTIKKLAELKPSFDKKEELKEKEADLVSIIQIKKLDVILLQIQKEATELATQITEKSQEIDSIKKQLTLLKASTAKEKKEAPDWEVLTKVQNWFTEKNNLLKNNGALQKEITEHDQNLQLIQAEKTNLLKETLINTLLTAEQKSLKVKELIDLLKTINKEKEQKFTDLEKVFSELQINEKLGNFVNQLKKNSPCPLCGAEQHPKIIKIIDVHAQLIRTKAEKEKALSEIKILNETISKLSVLYEKFNGFYSAKKKLTEKHEQNKE
ncbi:MAG: AAA family ATPase, partial [Candidatus Margulisiibacteriota bacterium]